MMQLKSPASPVEVTAVHSPLLQPPLVSFIALFDDVVAAPEFLLSSQA
jgi:hypothetical protein